MLKEYTYIAGVLVFLKWSNRGFKVDINTSLATFYIFFAFKLNDDNSVVYLIKDETLKVPKTALFNLQKALNIATTRKNFVKWFNKVGFHN